MDYVRLASGLPPSSRLGFGCGSIMGRIGRAQSLRAIDAAYDAGVTHFDVAPLYGYGEAEALLGSALRGRRDRVVIASKYGLAPTRAASLLRGLKPLAQRVAAAVPGLRPLIRASVGTARAGDRFSPKAAEESLKKSLRALNTDYLDILLLHDGGAADLSAELTEFLRGQAAAGTIRAFGLASGIDTITELIARHGDELLYQFANSVCRRNTERLPPGEARFIGHSPFHGADHLRALLAARPGGMRLPDGRPIGAGDIHRLMLGYALTVDSVAVVLCSMLDPNHLRDNLSAVERPAFTPAEIAGFGRVVRALQPEDAARPGSPRS